jgi:hypothetical protein
MYEVGRDDQDQPQYVKAEDYDKAVADGTKAAAELHQMKDNYNTILDEVVRLGAELAGERERHQELREALSMLSNEASGWLDLEPIRLAGVMGNTNIAVMQLRVDEARDLLVDKAEPKPAPIATNAGEEK